jgi:hypothetical protein
MEETRMSESTTTDATKDTGAATATDASTTASTTDVDKPLGENGEKALKAEREARAAAERSAAALQKQLDDIAAANLSDLEKAQKTATDAQAAAAKATAEALRLRVAAKHGINDEDADLFLTGSDLETVEKQAAALVARTSNGPKPDLSQGAKDTTAAGGSPEQDFANFIGKQLAG